RKSSRDLVMVDPDNETEFFFLRPKDIAVYVGEGILQAGITGRDMLMDSRAPVDEVLALGFGGSTFRFAAPIGEDMTLADLDGKRIATPSARGLRSYMQARGIKVRETLLKGEVGSTRELDVANAVGGVVYHRRTM